MYIYAAYTQNRIKMCIRRLGFRENQEKSWTKSYSEYAMARWPKSGKEGRW